MPSDESALQFTGQGSMQLDTGSGVYVYFSYTKVSGNLECFLSGERARKGYDVDILVRSRACTAMATNFLRN